MIEAVKIVSGHHLVWRFSKWFCLDCEQSFMPCGGNVAREAWDNVCPVPHGLFTDGLDAVTADDVTLP